LTVLLSGFELENLAAGIAANAHDLPGAAAGTFLGGTTFLALAVAGIAALLSPMQARLPSAVLGWTAAAPVPLLVLSLDDRLSRVDGALLLAWFAIALYAISRSAKDLMGQDDFRPRRRPLLRIFGGLAALTAGGDLLGEGLRRVVSRFDISSTLLGNTALAASVEAEEIARVAVPARHGRGELGFANVAGTIVHFVGLNAGVIALVRPLELDSQTTHLHLPVTVGAVATLCVLLFRRQGLGKTEGAALLALYGAYVAVAIVVAAGG